MTGRGVRDESGQALVIAAMGAFVLAAALVLTIDWGYALLQRRIAQNDADKVALAVGRLLATSVAPYQGDSLRFAKTGSSAFRVENLTHRELCTVALDAQQRDPKRTTLALVSSSLWLDFERWDPDSPSPNTVRANCASAQSRSVDWRTTTVRVRIERRYKALYAGLLRQSDVFVGATARAALTGAPFTADSAEAALPANPTQADYADLARSAVAVRRTWPIVRRYSELELAGRRPCGPTCDPRTAATPFRFARDGLLESNVQFIDLSRDSSRTPREQLITEPEAATASLADGFDQPFGGVLGLDTDWDKLAPIGWDEVIPPSPSRNACNDLPRWLLGVDSGGDEVPPPSCQVNTRGDWVETYQSDLVGSDLVNRMRTLIQTAGVTTQYSGMQIPTAVSSRNGGSGTQFGKAVVVWVYFWDCGQDFDEGAQRWTGSCSTSQDDRVHLFTVVPITFYEGLVTTRAIEGYWGGGFVDPGRCQTAPGSCPTITALANSAFLVADDTPWDPTIADAAQEDDPLEEVLPPGDGDGDDD